MFVEPIDLFGFEFETLEGFEDTTNTCDDTETTGGGKAASEDLEGGCPPSGPRLEGGVEHGEFVHVGQQ